MSSSYAESFARLESCLDEIGAVDPSYRTTTEKREALGALVRARARVEAELLRVLAASEDVAEDTGARSAAVWLADQARESRGDAGLGPAGCRPGAGVRLLREQSPSRPRPTA